MRQVRIDRGSIKKDTCNIDSYRVRTNNLLHQEIQVISAAPENILKLHKDPKPNWKLQALRASLVVSVLGPENFENNLVGPYSFFFRITEYQNKQTNDDIN